MDGTFPIYPAGVTCWPRRLRFNPGGGSPDCVFFENKFKRFCYIFSKDFKIILSSNVQNILEFFCVCKIKKNVGWKL